MLSAVFLVALGAAILICPEKYIGSLILALGYALVITCIVKLLDFFTSKNALMEYLRFVVALLLGIAGLFVLVFRDDVMRTLAWLSSFLMLLDGLRSLFYSLTYARRARRKNWWVLTILAVFLMVLGVLLFLNPWWNTPDMLMKVIGCAILFLALVSVIRMLIVWPHKKPEGGDNDGKE